MRSKVLEANIFFARAMVMCSEEKEILDPFTGLPLTRTVRVYLEVLTIYLFVNPCIKLPSGRYI